MVDAPGRARGDRAGQPGSCGASRLGMLLPLAPRLRLAPCSPAPFATASWPASASDVSPTLSR
eukprot:1770108-Rhodomonas_salina.3